MPTSTDNIWIVARVYETLPKCQFFCFIYTYIFQTTIARDQTRNINCFVYCFFKLIIVDYFLVYLQFIFFILIQIVKYSFPIDNYICKFLQ